LESSKYLEAFKKAKEHFTMYGGKILEQGEIKSSGGIILAERSDHRSDIKHAKPLVCTVLAVGEGYTNDEGDADIPPSVEAGNVVVLNANGVSFFSTIPGVTSYSNMSIGICLDSDVQLKFKDLEAFKAYAGVMNEVK